MLEKWSKMKGILGNPLLVRKRKSVTFEFIVNKVKSKIASWKAHLLSKAGRNVQIKYVASTILVYNMFVLQLLKNTTDQIDKCLKNSGGERKKKPHYQMEPNI